MAISNNDFGSSVSACVLEFLSRHDMGRKNRILFSCNPGTVYCTFYMGGVCLGIEYDGHVLKLSSESVFRVNKSNMLYYRYHADDSLDTVMLAFARDLEVLYDELTACAASGLRRRFVWPFVPVADRDDCGIAEKNRSQPEQVDKPVKKPKVVDKLSKKPKVVDKLSKKPKKG